MSGDAAPARRDEPPAPARPQRHEVQFTATQEYVELLERARDLLSHAVPDRSFEAVHLRALRELVEKLEKKKYAATTRAGAGAQREAAPPSDPRQRGASAPPGERAVPRRRGNNLQADDPAEPRRRGTPSNAGDPRRRDTIPAAIRRAVRQRDGARCSYVDERGQRCRETTQLEFHHEQPFARGGATSADNLTLRCRAHNALAAEEDFGRMFMEEKKPAAPDG